MSENSVNTEYNQKQYNHNYPNGMENHYWNLHRNKLILKYIKKHKLDNVLDVGCGRGIVSIFLKENQVNVEGIELGDTTLIRDSNLKVKFNSDALKMSSIESLKYNTISLYDVLEHIEKPTDFINKLSDKFKNVNRYILTIPARKELWTNFDEYFGHYRRYDLKMIEKEFENTDFEIEYKGYFFHVLYILIKLNNIFVKNRKISFSVPNGFSRIIHKFISKILIFDSLLIPSNILGSSILVIAHRKNHKK